MSTSNKPAIEELIKSSEEYDSLLNELEEYFTKIVYSDSTLFSDGTHLNEPEKSFQKYSDLILNPFDGNN